MTTVVFHIQSLKDSTSDGLHPKLSTFSIDSHHNITCREVYSNFPIVDDTREVWLDLQDDAIVPKINNQIIIKALNISNLKTSFTDPFPFDLIKTQHTKVNDVIETMNDVHEDLGTFSAVNMEKVVVETAINFTRTIRPLANSTTKTVHTLGQILRSSLGFQQVHLADMPSDIVCQTLKELACHLEERVESRLTEHQNHLEKLWNISHPEIDFCKQSPLWKNIGFQSENPITDFRGGGFLSLTCLAYTAQKYPNQWRSLIQSQLPHAENTFPVSATGVNITLMLASLFHIDRDDSYTRTHKPYWKIFQDGTHVFHQLFAIAMFLFSQEWIATSATFSEFKLILKSVEEAIEDKLISISSRADSGSDIITVDMLITSLHENGYVFF